MTVTNDTTLLIKLPSELKGAFQGLCKARGVHVSEELRRFMADEVVKAGVGMTTAARCDKTPDMFDNAQNGSVGSVNVSVGGRQSKGVNKAKKGNSGVSTAQLSTYRAKNSKSK